MISCYIHDRKVPSSSLTEYMGGLNNHYKAPGNLQIIDTVI